MNRETAILFSGGMDSALLAKRAKERSADTRLIFFDYGQPHNSYEYEAAVAVADHLGLEHPEVLEANIFGTMREGETPVVPWRNLCFIALACNYAPGISRLEIGCCRNDFEGFEDCRKGWLDLMREVTRPRIDLRYPLVDRTKEEIREELGLPLFKKTRSCYYPRETHLACGECSACHERGYAS